MNPTPWLTEDFIRTFESWPTSCWNMFEWGAGGSTIWFGKRVRSLTSIEHDIDWHNTVQEALKAEPRALPVNLFYIPLTDPEYFAKVLSSLPWHCILIDGRQRVKCGLNALKNLAPNGVLILDNADRKEYGELMEACDRKMPRIQTSNGQWRTDYWTRSLTS